MLLVFICDSGSTEHTDRTYIRQIAIQSITVTEREKGRRKIHTTVHIFNIACLLITGLDERGNFRVKAKKILICPFFTVLTSLV